MDGLSGPPGTACRHWGASQLLATFHRSFENAFKKLCREVVLNTLLRCPGVSAQHQLNSCCIFNLFIACS